MLCYVLSLSIFKQYVLNLVYQDHSHVGLLSHV